MSSKLIAMQHYVEKGYFCYNETNNTGPIDFIAINPDTGDMQFFDVKTLSRRSSTAKAPNTKINRVLTPVQKKLGVKLLYVNLKTKKISP